MNDSGTTRKKGRSWRGLSAHSYRLLAAIYFWRYVSVAHVQTLFAENYPRSQSTANYQLRRLVEQGLLKVAPRVDRSRPHVYSITAAGLQEVNRHFGWQLPVSVGRERTVHPLLLDHELELSDFQSALYREAAGRTDIQLPWFERRYFRADRRLPADGGQWYEPDLGFPIISGEANGRRSVTLYFCEWDRGTQRPAAVREKFLAADEWYAKAGERTLTALHRRLGVTDVRPRYRRLVVTAQRRDGSDFARLVQLYAQALRVGESSRNIFFTTRSLVRSDGSEWNLGGSPIWYAIYRFGHSWWREIAEDLNRSHRAPAVHAYVARRLKELGPTWSIFPPSPVGQPTKPARRDFAVQRLGQ